MVAACFLGPFIFPIPTRSEIMSQALLAPKLLTGHLRHRRSGNDILSLLVRWESVDRGRAGGRNGLIAGTPSAALAGYRRRTDDRRSCDSRQRSSPSRPGSRAGGRGPTLVRTSATSSLRSASSRFLACQAGQGRDLATVAGVHRRQLDRQRGRKIITHHVLPNVLPNLMTFVCLLDRYRDRRRSDARLPRCRRAASAAELGQSDRHRSAVPLAGAVDRARPELLPLCHRYVPQPSRRRAACAPRCSLKVEMIRTQTTGFAGRADER